MSKDENDRPWCCHLRCDADATFQVSLAYPEGLDESYEALDACDVHLAEILRTFGDRHLLVLAYPGKPSCDTEMVPQTRRRVPNLRDDSVDAGEPMRGTPGSKT